MIILIAAFIFLLFIGAYILLTAAVIHHLRQYTLPGWTAARFVVPFFFFLSLALFAYAVYFFFTTPWNLLAAPSI